jgi:hypothetical protein
VFIFRKSTKSGALPLPSAMALVKNIGGKKVFAF